jgi:hypothetical protein
MNTLSTLLAYSINLRDPLVLLLIVLLIVACLPAWPYSRSWGYPPVLLIVVVIVILLLVLR